MSWLRVRQVLLAIILIYGIYVLVSGILIFYVIKPEPAKNVDLQFNQTDERVTLIDRPADAWQSRVDLIKSAQETLDISYYAFHGGESVEVFAGLVLDSADRGVNVRFLLDGLANGLMSFPEIYQLLASHPNIEFYFYEPLNLLKPWTWQNRMHDKIIIADNQVAMMGGRNIGDKYFTDNVPSLSIDRDVMLFKGDQAKDTDLIAQIANHYQNLLNSDITVSQDKTYSDRKMSRVEENKQDLINKMSEVTDPDPTLSGWLDRSHSINQATFVTNPIGRLYKESTVWAHLLALTEQAERSVTIQSPYVIPTKQMKDDIQNLTDDYPAVETRLLTNSLASTNNVIANSGYQANRQAILNMGIQLYEFSPEEAQFHTKAFIIDNQVSAIGTFNIDSRSAYLNTESMLIIDSPEFTQELFSNIYQDYGDLINKIDPNYPIDKSDYGAVKGFLSKILQPLARLFAPFL